MSFCPQRETCLHCTEGNAECNVDPNADRNVDLNVDRRTDRYVDRFVDRNAIESTNPHKPLKKRRLGIGLHANMSTC